MKAYTLKFMQRGLAFGGFGPIVAGTVYLILSMTLPDFSLSGVEVFTAILSTYLLAFLQAGASIFHQIEHWSAGRALLCHGLTLYVAYAGCYLLNRWIPFELGIFLGFTLIFAVCYLIIWLVVYLIVRNTMKKMNRALQ